MSMHPTKYPGAEERSAMTQAHYRIARDFFAAVSAGELPDAMLTPDMTGWLTTAGTVDKASYQAAVRLLERLFVTPLTFTIGTLTADADRVVAEVESEGTLITGEVYRNTYVFVLRIRDGRIAAIAEHYNALIAEEKLLPVIRMLRQQPAND